MKNYGHRIKRKTLILFSKMIAPVFKNRKSELMLFGSRNGDYYMDNSRALFEWYLQNRHQNVIWMTKSEKVFAKLEAQKIPVAKIDSVKGVILLSKAKYGFYTNRLLDIAISDEAIPSSIKMIFLSHGQSVKNTRLAVKEGINAAYERDTLKASSQMVFAASTSPFMAEVQSKSNGIPPSKYKITGFPRNDWMFKLPNEATASWNLFTGGATFKKVILYAPTWRMKGPKTKMFPFSDLETKALAKYIEDNNFLLLLRPHLQDLVNNEPCRLLLQELTSLTKNIRIATNEHFLDANLLLPFVDVLISDYSSIYHDFLILDRPIFFIPYDIANFDKVNGFKYPYLETLPGPVISSQQDLVGELSFLNNGQDHYTKKRIDLRNKLYVDFDGNACERVAAEIIKLNN